MSTSIDHKTQALIAIQNLGTDDNRDVALEAMKRLDSTTKAEVAREAGIVLPPSPRVANIIWLVVVTAFALVLLGSAGSLFFGVLASSKTTELQVLLTIFTSVVGFLAGLLAPSPLQKSSANS